MRGGKQTVISFSIHQDSLGDIWEEKERWPRPVTGVICHSPMLSRNDSWYKVAPSSLVIIFYFGRGREG